MKAAPATTPKKFANPYRALVEAVEAASRVYWARLDPTYAEDLWFDAFEPLVRDLASAHSRAVNTYRGARDELCRAEAPCPFAQALAAIEPLAELCRRALAGEEVVGIGIRVRKTPPFDPAVLLGRAWEHLDRHRVAASGSGRGMSPKEANLKMLADIADDNRRAGWSQKEWARSLGCSESTINKTPTWQRMMDEQKAEWEKRSPKRGRRKSAQAQKRSQRG
jgi:hypothetical protein